MRTPTIIAYYNISTWSVLATDWWSRTK